MNMSNHLRVSRGFTLIEVLIALFILAVGILGIIGLQLFAKQNNFDSVQRTAAATLATDIVERMRMNKSALADYISTKEPVAAPAAIPTDCAASGTPCTPSELAQHDLNTWYSLISGLSDKQGASNVGGLTEPSACIIQDPSGVGGVVGKTQYRIVIAWRGRTPLSNSTRSTCGNDATGARYGAGDAYRRIFILDARIE